MPAPAFDLCDTHQTEESKLGSLVQAAFDPRHDHRSASRRKKIAHSTDNLHCEDPPIHALAGRGDPWDIKAVDASATIILCIPLT